MTSSQIEGDEPMHENWGGEAGESIDEVGDPPRVWTIDLDLPGCAFTRSLGDMMATEGIGSIVNTFFIIPMKKVSNLSYVIPFNIPSYVS